jgi:hypothetical protein
MSYNNFITQIYNNNFAIPILCVYTFCLEKEFGKAGEKAN